MSFWKIAKDTGNSRDRDERNVVACYSESLRSLEGRFFTNILSYKPDPPDCIGYDESGNLIAFEVTELTDQNAERENAKKSQRDYYKDWDVIGLAQAIKEKIIEKDSKLYHGGPYNKIVLIIYTDELSVIEDMIRQGMNSVNFRKLKPKTLTEVIFLFSYEPNPGKLDYPFFKIYSDKN